MGGVMMTPVGRMVRTISKRELVGAMTWVTTPVLVGRVPGPPGRDRDRRRHRIHGEQRRAAARAGLAGQIMVAPRRDND